MEKKCLQCGKVLDAGKDCRAKFCNSSCAAIYNNARKPKPEKNRCGYCGKETNNPLFCNIICSAKLKHNQYIERWKRGEEDGCSGGEGISTHIRTYITEKYGSKCCKCGWNEINPTTGKVPVQVEHIDGNHKNNREENLLLLCPNCHSLTPTYGNLNKGNGRKARRIKRAYVSSKQ